jgi:FtsH ternary system domain X5
MACGMNLELGLEGVRRVFRTSRAEEGVDVVDEVHLDVALLPVLPDSEMRDIVREMLREGGWSAREDGSIEKVFGSAVATLSPDGASVTLRVRAESTVSATGTAEVTNKRSESAADREAAERAERQLEGLAKKERERLAAENVKTLTREEPEMRAEVQRALNRTYRKALETRARRMGEVESLNERGDEAGSYEVTVVVKA